MLKLLRSQPESNPLLFFFYLLLFFTSSLEALLICNEIVPTQPSVILIVISFPHYTLVYSSYMVKSMFLSKEILFPNLGTN